MSQALLASLHTLSFLLLFCLLALEHREFCLPLDAPRARRLILLDIGYGLAAGLVLVTGALRVLWFGKGLDYYLQNGLFHAKLGLFLLVGLISILPTLTALNLRPALQAGTAPEITPRRLQVVLWTIRIELLLLASLPVLASLLARGYGAV